MLFNWKLNSFRRFFRLKPKAKKSQRLEIESLEARIECATRVWNGALVPSGSDGVIGPPPTFGANGDPTFSSFMATFQTTGGGSLGNNWDPTLGQSAIPSNGDTLLFPLLAAANLTTPAAGVFGNLTRIDTVTPFPLPTALGVNVINDLTPDTLGFLPGYLRDSTTGENSVNPLNVVDQIQFTGSGYSLYMRDFPQFGPTNGGTSPPFLYGSSISAEYFFPGATDGTSPFFDPTRYTFSPLTAPVGNNNNPIDPALPLNVQTQLVADYVGNSNTRPTATNANWIYMPLTVGNPLLPAGSSFVLDVVQEGSWIVTDSDINEAAGSIGNPAGYALLRDVNDNKIVKRGLGTLAFESLNNYTGTTIVEKGQLILADDAGLGDSSVNSNVEVYNGSLILGSESYGQLEVAPPISNRTINNRNAILTGGDGFLPTIGTTGVDLKIPVGQLAGRNGPRANPHNWNGTVTLNTNLSEVTTSNNPNDPFGVTTAGLPANPNGDPSIGQDFGSFMNTNGVISGVAGLRKWGPGTMGLTQANTFSGDIVVFDGFLNAQNNLALGNVDSTGVKDIFVRDLPSTLLAGGVQRGRAGALTLGNDLIGNQVLVFGPQYKLVIQTSNAGTAINGPDQNPGAPLSAGTALEGLGAFQITGPNNSPNSATWQGAVELQTNASIGGTPGGSLTISGKLSAGLGVQLEKRGSNTLALSNSNTGFLGKILVSSGNLQVLNNNALGNPGSIIVQQTSPAPPALPGAGSIQLVGNGLNVNEDLDLSSTGFNGFGGLQSIGSNTWSGDITILDTSSIGAPAGSTLILAGKIDQGATTPASASLIKIGAGTAIITQQLSLTLPINVQEGTLIVQTRGNLGAGTSGAVTVSTSIPSSPATLALQGGVTINNRTLNLDGIGIAAAGALRSLDGKNTWGGPINLAGSSQLAYIGVDTDTLTLAGRIDGGSSTLHKTGAGTLIISASGNSQGSTIIGAGTLFQLGKDNVPVFVNTSGTLQGNGKVGVLTMQTGQAGVVDPGTQTSKVALLTTAGLNLQGSVGTLNFDLDQEMKAGAGTQPIAGTGYDQIVVNGVINLLGNPILDLDLNFNPTQKGTVYTIVSNDGSDAVIGNFNGLAEGALITVNNISFRVSYRGGDGNDITLTTAGVLTSTVLSSSDLDNTTIFGQPLTFTVNISAPTGVVTSGSVQFFDQSIAIGQPISVVSGTATLAQNSLTVQGSPHVITSTYVGTGIFSDSSSNILAHSITKASSTTLVVSNSSIYGAGLSLTLTATITPQFQDGPGTGQVLFSIDGNLQPVQTVNTTVTDAATGARTAIFTTTLDTLGFHTVQANYLGDSNINGSGFSPIFTQQILPTANTAMTLTSSRNPADRGDTVVFTATATSVNPADGVPVGLVQFFDNGVALGAPVPLFPGVAQLPTNALSGGRHVIMAQFLGAPDNFITKYYAPSSATIAQAVQAVSNLIVTGTNIGGGPQVNVYNQLTGSTAQFFAFAPSFTGGVRVATGDVNGDSVSDVVVAAGPGGGPQVNVYDGATLALTRSFYAYDPAFQDGIFIAVGDINGDGFADIITGAGQGGGPHIQVFSGLNNSVLASFFAYEPTFTGGTSVGAGDVNADGYVDVVIGAGIGGGPHVRAVSGLQLSNGVISDLANFMAFDPEVRNGVFVSSGDYDSQAGWEIFVAAGKGGGPHVKVFNGSGTNLVDTFFAYASNFSGGVTVGAVDIDNDGIAELITAPNSDGSSNIKVFKFLSGSIKNFLAYDPAYIGGVFVG